MHPLLTLLLCWPLVCGASKRSSFPFLGGSRSSNRSRARSRPTCSLSGVAIDLFNLILPNSLGSTAQGAQLPSAPCEERYAFQLMRHSLPDEQARLYKIEQVLGCGLNGVTLAVTHNGGGDAVVKVVVLDTSSKAVEIPESLTGGAVRAKKIFGEFERHKAIYGAYRQLSVSNPAVHRGLPFRIFDIYNISNYTFFKSLGRPRMKHQRMDVAYYMAERIPPSYSAISWGYINKRGAQLARLESYFELFFRSLIELFTRLGVVHGDMHFGNAYYDHERQQIAIFDFDRSFFVENYSEYLQHALFLRDYLTPLAFLHEYYKSIDIKTKVVLSNRFCEIGRKHLKLMGSLKHSSEKERAELEGFKDTYLKNIDSVSDYKKIIAEKGKVFEKLDQKFWKIAYHRE